MPYASILEQEIFQQPEVLEQFLAQEREHAKQIAADLKGRFKYVVIAARGTSDNAARYAQYLFGTHNHLQVALATPSIFTMYGSAPDLSEALVIGISQSGQSPDIVSVLAEARRQGRPTLSVTNDVNSPLAQTSDHVMALNAGLERAVAATKTYTSSLMALALLSCAMEENPRHMQELSRIPTIMRELIMSLPPVLEGVKRYRYMEHCAVLGRGYNYATAFEIALKVKELTHAVAEPYSSADFRHGPIATVHQGFPVFVIAPRDSVHQDMLDLLNHLQRLKAELIVISDDPDTLRFAHLGLPIPSNLPEWLTPLVAVVPGQLFAYQLTIEKGLNPDQPEGLKKVTETL